MNYFTFEYASLDNDGFGSLNQWAVDEPACDKMSGRSPSAVGRKDDVFMITNPDLVPIQDTAWGIKPLHPGDIQPSVTLSSSNYHLVVDDIDTADIACLRHDVQAASSLSVPCPGLHNNTPATDLPNSLTPKDDEGIASHHATNCHTPETSRESQETPFSRCRAIVQKKKAQPRQARSTSNLRARKVTMCFGDEVGEYEWDRRARRWNRLEQVEHTETADDFLGDNLRPFLHVYVQLDGEGWDIEFVWNQEKK
ncbi:Uu.00g130540.m01.CDS01 [Anthostomella pinea]|uniref:Uu.00g130540.m01.CDS01 n=1 Tax=Anthostomella pinea TaxID=933095 RepID=A0AAI8VIQ3_9PEZI|nr:Uu.00g130540.m01.CDS01 [Anthostomella pinea]